MKPTQFIVVAVLICTSIVTYGLSQTSTKVFYVAATMHDADKDLTTLPQLADSISVTTEQPPSEITVLKLAKQAISENPPITKVSNIKNLATTKPKSKVTVATTVFAVVATTTSIAKKIPAISVPFISQLTDIIDPEWKKIGCGIASLAMIVNFYEPKSVGVNNLLDEGISAGAYSDAGWIYSGLISIAKKHGLAGQAYDLAGQSTEIAFSKFTSAVAKGPVMASVHYKFEPDNPIPHLVVITNIKDNLVYYNDPASTSGNRTISLTTFKNAWKKRYLEFTPA